MLGNYILHLVKSQLKDQLPGGKYYKPTQDVLEETKNCANTNVISERDFAQWKSKMEAKPNMTSVAAAGVIMYNNNDTLSWLDRQTDEYLDKIVKISRGNKESLIQGCKVKDSKLFSSK